MGTAPKFLAVSEEGVKYGNNENQEPIRFQRHHRIEITQKSANPVLSVYGNDPDAMIAEVMETYDKYVAQFAKRGKAVGPISSS